MKFLTSIDLSQNEIQNAIMQPLAAPPANPKIGQIYFNSIDLTLYLWTGEKWIPVPTKTSQLENDSGFITSGDIPEGAAASTTTPKMNGTAAVGTEMAFARGDHVHPDPTSRSLLHHRAPVRRAGPALLLLQAGGRRHRHSGQDLRRQQRPRHNQRRGGEILRQATDTRGHTSGPM